jgi:hypothetical protein
VLRQATADGNSCTKKARKNPINKKNYAMNSDNRSPVTSEKKELWKSRNKIEICASLPSISPSLEMGIKITKKDFICQEKNAKIRTHWA